MKEQDEDNVLTAISHVWISIYKSGTQSSLDELLQQIFQISERFGGYTATLYNLLGLVLLMKADIDKAVKIYD